MSEKKTQFTPVEDLYKFLGLDYNPPKGAIECLKHAYGIVPFIRSGLNRIMNLGSVKR